MTTEASTKREQTLAAKYGPDWRKVIGQKAKVAREKKYGKEVYARAGRIGGAKGAPESRAFSKDHELARSAGKKGAQARWGQPEC
jgi:general stress protein YciG